MRGVVDFFAGVDKRAETLVESPPPLLLSCAALHLLASVERDEASWIGRSLTAPVPIAYSPEFFASALDTHARFLSSQLEPLLEVITGIDEEDHLLDSAHDFAARASLLPGRVRLECERRDELSPRLRRWPGVHRHLYLQTPPRTIDVVVRAQGAMSVQRLALEPKDAGPRRLRIIERDLVVEPCDQRHCDSDEWLITRWAFGGEARYVWTPIPPEPRTFAEAVDRFVKLYEPLLWSQAWAYMAREKSFPLLTLTESPWGGDRVHALPSQAWVAMTVLFPRIHEALARVPALGWLPVLAFMPATRCGLRWLKLDATRTEEMRPPELEEVSDRWSPTSRPDAEPTREETEETLEHLGEYWPGDVGKKIEDCLDAYLTLLLWSGGEEQLAAQLGREKIDAIAEKAARGGIDEDALGRVVIGEAWGLREMDPKRFESAVRGRSEVLESELRGVLTMRERAGSG